MVHYAFELLAYNVGFVWYLRQRRTTGDVIDVHARWWIVAAAIAGAAVGSKVLFWFEDPGQTLAHWSNPVFLMSGKTVVGGLAGGLVGVELTKRRLGIEQATGDLFAVPLALGIAIGRIGCFFAGLADQTYGTATTLPWGVDFGDGIMRHPTQLYETMFLVVVAAGLSWYASRQHRQGDVFKLFLAAYMAFRLLVDFIKPEVRLALGLSAIQWTALAVLLYYARHLRSRLVTA